MQSSIAIAEDAERREPVPGRQWSADAGPDRFLRSRSSQIALLLSLVAAVRVLFFCAAFPLTNIIDERFHLLTIQMYAQAHLPGKELPHVDPESARRLLPYWSPEYSHSQKLIDRAGAERPLYGLPVEARNAALATDFYADKLKQWEHRPNYEAQSPPLYYIVAAGWYRLGAALGMEDWLLDYWPRFLNPIAYAVVVWISYLFARRVYPERIFLHVALPAFIAFFPQDVFFGMNRDVFSAPLSAAALLLMVQAMETEPNRARDLLLGSFVTGLAFLTSVANFVLWGPLAVTLWVVVRKSVETTGRKLLVVFTNVLAAGLLPSLWLLRNYFVMGDLTGGRAKEQDFTWTVKPLGEMLHHPLFSWHGLSYFVIALTRSFWRGEYGWHGLAMRSVSADRFYVSSSFLFLAVFAIDWVVRRNRTKVVQRLVEFQMLLVLIGSVLFLATISLPFDFHDCAYPSRALPYFVSGRIISGAILPFALMYLIGMDVLLGLVRNWVRPLVVLVCFLLLITASEIRVRRVVFSSPYNFFALSGWRR